MKRLTFAALDLAICFAICFSLVVATAHQAFGYVDPGSGLLALQSAASVVAAGAYFLRRRIRSLFLRTSDADKPALPVPPNDTTPAKAA
jgi:hypothetical protein